MTQENLIQALLDFRTNKIKDAYFLTLSDDVEFVVAWLKNLIRHRDNKIYYAKNRHKFYLIKNAFGKYASIVQSIEGELQDLHWYVLDSERKQGHLTNALKKTILPHLMINKEVQRITIDVDAIGELNYQNSKKVALKVGFEQLTDEEFHFKKSNDQSTPNMYLSSINRDNMARLKDKISDIEIELDIIDQELKLNGIDSKRLKEITDQLSSFKRYRMEDEIFEAKQETPHE